MQKNPSTNTESMQYIVYDITAQHHSNTFILPLKLDDSFIPTHLIYSDI